MFPLAFIAVFGVIGGGPAAVRLGITATDANSPVYQALERTPGVLLVQADSLPKAGGWAAGSAVAFYCCGPGSRRPRRQLRRMTGGAIRSRAVMMVALISSWALAAAAVSSVLSQPPLVWPATSWMLPQLPSLGRVLHSVQQGLLGHAVRMLHLP